LVSSAAYAICIKPDMKHKAIISRAFRKDTHIGITFNYFMAAESSDHQLNYSWSYDSCA
jgi:hypothetical protein